MPTGASQQDKAGSPEPEIFWVSPWKPIPAQTVELPAGDQIGIRIMTPAVMCYKTTPEYDEKRFIDSVKKAAAGTVSEIPTLAGKVVFTDETCKAFKLVTEDNTKIEVRIKRLPHLDANELEAKHWPPHLYPRSDISMVSGPMSGIGSFSFAVQANLFKGGAIIVLLMNHILLDGFSIGDLETTFAHHLASGMDGKPTTPSGLFPPEAIDKSPMWGSSNARPLTEWKDWRPAPQMNLSPEEVTAAIMARFSKLSATIWYVSPEKQAQLRADSQLPGQKLSLHICFSAWLWRVYTRARGLSPDTVTRNFTTTQTRGRVEGVHPHYSGNALVYGRAKATAAELRTLPTSALGDRIGKSVSWWTPERIREQWGSINDHVKKESISTVQPSMDRDFGTDVEFSNITNTTFYKLHWGRGLEVARYRPTEIAFADGYVIMFPKFKDGGFEILIYAEIESLKKMCADPKFREYVEYRVALNPAIDELVANTVVGKASL